MYKKERMNPKKVPILQEQWNAVDCEIESLIPVMHTKDNVR